MAAIPAHMIEAKVQGGARLVANLSAKAKALAIAHAKIRMRDQRLTPWKWRRADLLWPNFGKER